MTKLNISTIKENRDFSHIDKETADLLIETLYHYSILSYNAYKNIEYERT